MFPQPSSCYQHILIVARRHPHVFHIFIFLSYPVNLCRLISSFHFLLPLALSALHRKCQVLPCPSCCLSFSFVSYTFKLGAVSHPQWGTVVHTEVSPAQQEAINHLLVLCFIASSLWWSISISPAADCEPTLQPQHEHTETKWVLCVCSCTLVICLHF